MERQKQVPSCSYPIQFVLSHSVVVVVAFSSLVFLSPLCIIAAILSYKYIWRGVSALSTWNWRKKKHKRIKWWLMHVSSTRHDHNIAFSQKIRRRDDHATVRVQFTISIMCGCSPRTRHHRGFRARPLNDCGRWIPCTVMETRTRLHMHIYSNFHVDNFRLFSSYFVCVCVHFSLLSFRFSIFQAQTAKI